jgi:hypothetical protein
MPAKHRWLPGGNERESTSLRSVLACGATCAGVCCVMWCNYVFWGGYQGGGGSVMSVGLSFDAEADVWVGFGAQQGWLREGACACNTGGIRVAIEEHACAGRAEHRRLPDGGCRVCWWVDKECTEIIHGNASRHHGWVCCVLVVSAILRRASVHSQQRWRREGAYA